MARTGQSSAFPANSLNSSSETILLPTSSPVGAGLGDGVLSSLPGREDAPTTENATPSSTTMGGSPAKNLEPGWNDSSLSTPEATGEQQTNQDVWKYVDDFGKTRRYAPDFFLPDYNCWLEVKGFWWGNDKRKMEIVTATYPDRRIVIVEQQEYNRIMQGELVWSFQRLPEEQ